MLGRRTCGVVFVEGMLFASCRSAVPVVRSDSTQRVPLVDFQKCTQLSFHVRTDPRHNIWNRSTTFARSCLWINLFACLFHCFSCVSLCCAYIVFPVSFRVGGEGDSHVCLGLCACVLVRLCCPWVGKSGARFPPTGM